VCAPAAAPLNSCCCRGFIVGSEHVMWCTAAATLSSARGGGTGQGERGKLSPSTLSSLCEAVSHHQLLPTAALPLASHRGMLACLAATGGGTALQDALSLEPQRNALRLWQDMAILCPVIHTGGAGGAAPSQAPCTQRPALQVSPMGGGAALRRLSASLLALRCGSPATMPVGAVPRTGLSPVLAGLLL
jgi:hypothetical protein